MRIKKPLAIFLAAVFIFACSSCKGRESELSSDDTSDAVTTEDVTTEAETTAPPMPEKTTFTLPSSAMKEGRLLYEYHYGHNGLSMTMVNYKEETPITYTVTFDGDGRPLSTEWVVAVNNIRTEKWKDEYTLDSAGNIVKEVRYCEGDVQHTYTYSYDEKGNMLTQRTYNNRKGTSVDYALTYDEVGACTGVTVSENGKPYEVYKEKSENTYDESGRLKAQFTPSYNVAYEYILEGEFVTDEKVVYSSGEYSWSYYYKYKYADGCLIQEDCSFNGVLVDTTYYTESRHLHYKKAVEWIFRERLP